MKLCLVQYSPIWEGKEENKKKISDLLKFSDKPDLLIFPEMTLTGFSMNAEKLYEDREGGSFKFFSELSEKHSVNIFAGIIEKENENFYNTLLHINSSGDLAAFYRKIHPFSYSDENKYYTGGTKPVITKINVMPAGQAGWKIGLSICYDLRFPELYRFYAKEKVDLIVNIANWPITRIDHWRTLLKARAIENQCYVAGVNRVGNDPKLSYNGFSSVFDPMGVELFSIKNDEGIFSVEIDINKVQEVRSKLPFLNDIKLI